MTEASDGEGRAARRRERELRHLNNLATIVEYGIARARRGAEVGVDLGFYATVARQLADGLEELIEDAPPGS